MDRRDPLTSATSFTHYLRCKFGIGVHIISQLLVLRKKIISLWRNGFGDRSDDNQIIVRRVLCQT